MKLKRSKKIILTVIMIAVMLFAFCNTTVFGEINDKYSANDSVSDATLEEAFNQSSLLELLAKLIFVIGQFLEWILGTVFQLLTGSSDFPWADRIVFNAVPMLDVNFINPAEKSFVGNPNIIPILKNIYSTILSLAVSFFGIVVLITAIKLVISTIASDKAKYKQAIIDWTIGFVLLFCMHYFISFIFYLNEQLVVVASEIVTDQLDSKNAIAQVKASENASTLIDSMGNSVYNGPGPNKGKKIKKILEDNQKILQTYINLDSSDSSRGIHEALMKDSKFYFDKAIDDEAQKQNLALIISWAADENISVEELTEIKEKRIFAFHFTTLYGQTITGTDFNNTFKGYAKKFNTVISANCIVGDLGLAFPMVKSPDYMFESSTGDGNELDSIKKNNTNVSYYFSGGYGDIKKENAGSLTLGKTLDAHMPFFWTDVYDDLIELKKASDTNSGKLKKGSGKASRLISDLASYYKQNASVKEFRDTNKTGLKDSGNINIQNMIMYAILVAQSLILFISYVKRLFYVLILALMAPIVVVVDFFQKFGK